MRPRQLATVTMLLGCLVARSANAAPSEAERRFEEGRALVQAGKPAEAIPKFLASLAAQPTSAATLNLADAYERVGKVASAYARFREVEAMALTKDPLRSEEARKRAEALAPRLSTITVAKPTQSDVRVTIDSITIDPSAWGAPRPYDQGNHEVVVDAGSTHVVSVVVISSEAQAVRVDVDRLLAGQGPPVQPPPGPPDRAVGPEPREASSDGSPLRTAAFVTAGLGTASAIVGGVLGVIALGKASDLKAACPAYPSCPPSREAELSDLDHSARSMGDASTALLVIGGALIVSGVVLYLVAPSRSSTAKLTAGGSAAIAAW